MTIHLNYLIDRFKAWIGIEGYKYYAEGKCVVFEQGSTTVITYETEEALEEAQKNMKTITRAK